MSAVHVLFERRRNNRDVLLTTRGVSFWIVLGLSPHGWYRLMASPPI